MAKIKVDAGKCIGCGSCAAVCPEGFEIKSGKAHAKKSKVEKITCEKKAADSCPVEAIEISE